MRYRKRIGVFFLALGLCCVLSAAAVNRINRVATVSATPKPAMKEIVIDPGHGGIDGGAIGVNDIIEKDVNLAISLKLRDILAANGFSVVMTRDKDESVYNKKVEDAVSQKKADMRNRLKIIQKNPDSLTVSIHQNHFEQSKYSGAQMFYSPNNPESEALARCLQQAFVTNLQKDNTREIKKAQKDLYLLYYSNTPTVLVECGFLSNPAEAKLLASEEYQNKIAFTVFCGISKYLQQADSQQGA